jgi:hypothetical protein
VYIAIDVSMMTIAVAIVSDERSHDRRFLISLVRQAAGTLFGRIIKVLACGCVRLEEGSRLTA